MPTPKAVLYATYVALFASLAAALADVLLLYSPNGGYEAKDMGFLLNIPANRMMLGHFLGIFCIPLSMLGLLHVFHCIKPAGKYLPYVVCFGAVYLGYPGVMYHGSVAYTAAFLQLANHGDVAAMGMVPHIRLLADPVAAFMPVAFIIVSLLFAYTVWNRETLYPRWMAFCNPFTFYLLCIVAYLTVPPIGNLLAPAGFNLSFFLFFICSLWAEGSATSRPQVV